MGFFGALAGIGKGLITAGIGVAEGVTGFDVPGIGPGDRFFGGGGGGVPGGQAGLTIAGLAAADPCTWPAKWDARAGKCTSVPFVGKARGRDSALQRPAGGGMGGWPPMEFSVSRADCGRGAVLGQDGLCYDKRSISNRQRMWPRARKPLLTGGDLNCIAKASRAANRMKTQTKRLKKLGMLPK